MFIAVVYNDVGNTDAPDQRDVLVQVDSIRDALITLGHEVETIACGLDLSDVRYRLRKMSP